MNSPVFPSLDDIYCTFLMMAAKIPIGPKVPKTAKIKWASLK